MSFKAILSGLFAATICTSALLVFSLTAFAQETPLTFDQIKTALESTSSGMSMPDKNAFITQRIKQRGVNFTLSPDISKKLTSAGASASLLAAIRSESSDTSQTSTVSTTAKEPDAKFNKLWVNQNVVREGRAGIEVVTDFVAYNVKDTALQLTIRFQGADGEMLKSDNINFANTSGQLALYKNFKPGFDAAAYKDWTVFVPYDVFPLTDGNHNIKIDADVIYPEGKVLKHLTLQPALIIKPKPSLISPKADFENMWVDYGVTEGGRLGMRIHVKLKVHNLKDVPVWLSITFEKSTGEKLTAANTLFADRSGGVTLTAPLTPASRTANYGDIAVFMPYSELNLPKGEYSLRMHTDLTYPDGVLIQHYKYYPFTFRQNV